MVAESKKVAWNASQGIISEISNRRSYANNFFVNGDIKKAFNTLISIKQSVIQSFTEPERTQLKKLEEKFNKLSPFLNRNASMSFNTNTREHSQTAKSQVTKIYSKYNDLLMDLLDDHGYLIGEQTDESRMRF